MEQLSLLHRSFRAQVSSSSLRTQLLYGELLRRGMGPPDYAYALLLSRTGDGAHMGGADLSLSVKKRQSRLIWSSSYSRHATNPTCRAGFTRDHPVAQAWPC